MGKKKARRLLLVFTVFIIIPAVTVAVLFLTAEEPPVETINRARENLTRARNAEAEAYAAELLEEAEQAWRQAMGEWKAQNEKWFVSRDFNRLAELSRLAADKAEAAYEQSGTLKDSFHHDISEALHYVETRLRNYEKYYLSLPSNKQFRTKYSSSKMIFLESKQAYERGQYTNVGTKLEQSRELINEAISRTQGLLDDYFRDLPQWKRWASETIEWSRSRSSTAIVVDKFARKCYVYRNGSLKKTFHAELGPNWIGPKLHQGDQATPEGKYHVTQKKRKRQTRYYKALLIDYPNARDKSRYDDAVRQGLISRHTGIGSLIEIHGEGNRGMDWTNGCVALDNKDMDDLYHMSSVGTPVTIVGSLKSLNELNGL